jgi:hypothetical protein
MFLLSCCMPQPLKTVVCRCRYGIEYWNKRFPHWPLKIRKCEWLPRLPALHQTRYPFMPCIDVGSKLTKTLCMQIEAKLAVCRTWTWTFLAPTAGCRPNEL